MKEFDAKGKDSTQNGSQLGGECESASVEAPTGNYAFELSDIDVTFPDGELTIVTGSTASGKTALLVSRTCHALISERSCADHDASARATRRDDYATWR